MTDDFNPVFTLETGVSSWEDDFLSTQDTDKDAVFRKIQVLDQHSGSTFSGRDDHLTVFDGSRFRKIIVSGGIPTETFPKLAAAGVFRKDHHFVTGLQNGVPTNNTQFVLRRIETSSESSPSSNSPDPSFPPVVISKKYGPASARLV